MKTISCSPTDMSDTELLIEVKRLADRERRTTAQLIAALAEVDARRLYLGEGCSSLFTYCTQMLHLSEHAAYARIEAARTARRFPVVLELLADGSIHMTAVGLLAPYLTEENHRELLQAARHKTRREVERLVAGLHPQPDVRPGTVTAIGPDLYRVLFTVRGSTYDKLRRVQDLMRHNIPDGNVAEIFDRALTLLLADLERTRLAAVKRPRAVRATNSHSRHIPAAVRRAVWARDGGQCAFVGASGRCTEQGFLEFHHVVPYAEGGKTSVENLQLRCRAHNAYEAEKYVGSAGPLVLRERAALFELGPDRVGDASGWG